MPLVTLTDETLEMEAAAEDNQEDSQEWIIVTYGLHGTLL
jgi:hypothetical protein